MKFKILCIFILSICFSNLNAQDFERTGFNTSFDGNERLLYLANYKIGFINVDIAVLSIDTFLEKIDDREAYKVQAIGEINPDYEWFFKMRDEYNVWLDKESLKPLFFKNDILEGDYRYYSNYTYDWDSLKVHTVEKKLRWEEEKKRTYDISNVSYDALSMFFNLRVSDVSKFKVNQVFVLKLVFANRIRTVELTYKGKEVKRIPGLGKQKTIKFECQLANDSGVSFEDGSSFSLWLSDDKNLIPLYIDTPIRVGSVRVRLYRAEGLKNPSNIKFRR